MISYSDKLPKHIRGKKQCHALSDDGERCKNKAVFEKVYHGDSEIYFGASLTWVTVYLCKKHSNIP